MLPLLQMLEVNNLSLRDAEAAGFQPLARAAQRCLRCVDSDACIRWLKRGADVRAPLCLNADYVDWLTQRRRLASFLA